MGGERQHERLVPVHRTHHGGIVYEQVARRN